MLSAVFSLVLPEISTSKVLKDLLRSFEVERPPVTVRPPSWDLVKVLTYLRSSPFEPLGSVDFVKLTQKVLFLISLATAKRVSEIQALSCLVAKEGDKRVLSYLPEFVAKTERAENPLPRSFPLKSLSDFVGNLREEMLLCPVRALDIYLKRTAFQKRPRSLFVSPKRRHLGITKNAISYFLRRLIVDAGAVEATEGPVPTAHSIRSVATSVAFSKNLALSKILEAATWRSVTTFSSFYLRDVSLSIGDIRSLGPIVTAGQVITPTEQS